MNYWVHAISSGSVLWQARVSVTPCAMVEHALIIAPWSASPSIGARAFAQFTDPLKLTHTEQEKPLLSLRVTQIKHAANKANAKIEIHGFIVADPRDRQECSGLRLPERSELRLCRYHFLPLGFCHHRQLQ